MSAPWTPTEDAAIRELYPTGGSAAVVKVLSHRTARQIISRAAHTGVKMSREHLRQVLAKRDCKHTGRDSANEHKREQEQARALIALELRKGWYPKAGMVEEASR